MVSEEEVKRFFDFFERDNISTLFYYVLSKRGFIVANDCKFNENVIGLLLPDFVKLVVYDSPIIDTISSFAFFSRVGTSDTSPEYYLFKNPPDDVLDYICRNFPPRGWSVKLNSSFIEFHRQVPWFDGDEKVWHTDSDISFLRILEGADLLLRDIISDHISFMKNVKKKVRFVIKKARKLANYIEKEPLPRANLVKKIGVDEIIFPLIRDVAYAYFGIYVAGEDSIIILNRERIISEGIKKLGPLVIETFGEDFYNIRPNNNIARRIARFIYDRLDDVSGRITLLDERDRKIIAGAIFFGLIRKHLGEERLQPWLESVEVIESE